MNKGKRTKQKSGPKKCVVPTVVYVDGKPYLKSPGSVLTRIVYDRITVINGQPLLYVSEREERNLIAKLANDILRSGYQADGVVALTKGGGWGMHLAGELHISYLSLATAHYTDGLDGMAKQMNEGVEVAEHMSTTSDLERRLKAGERLNLLVVDDLADRGLTFDEVEFELREGPKYGYGQNFELRFVAEWRKSKASCHVAFIGKVMRPHKGTGMPVWIKTQEDQRYDDIRSRIDQKLLHAFLRRKKSKR